jgi:hypothetical protein
MSGAFSVSVLLAVVGLQPPEVLLVSRRQHIPDS